MSKKVSNLIKKLLKREYLVLILVTALVFAVFSEVKYYFVDTKMQSLSLTLNYPNSEKGLNPDGSRFNMSEIKSDYILDEVIERMGYDMTAQYLQSRLFIGAKIPQTAIDTTISSIQSGETYTYLPTTFSIYYSQKNKIAPSDAAKLLTVLAEVYEEHFNECYTEKNTVLEFDAGDYDFSDYDYSDIYTVLDDKINSMIIYISSHMSENNSFKSSDNVNFSSVIAELQNLQDVDLAKYQAYITQNSISKDKSEYLDKLDYLIDETDRLYEKANGGSEITKAALEKYDSSLAGVAYIPSVDNSNSFYMSRTKTGLDDLTTNSYTRGIRATEYLKTLDSYNNIYEKVSSSEQASAEELDTADEMIVNICSYLENVSDVALSVDNEYLEYKTKNYITFRLPTERGIINISLMIKYAVLGLIAGVILAVLWVIFRGYY
ncbi:MAG: hypothetical protein LUD03_03260, partial [Firmicutes bacterium]|nr:hypothetical protein [Bacillota bacterium]